MVKLLKIKREFESVTLMFALRIVLLEIARGVPLMTPLLLSDKPSGNNPDSNFQVKPVPPLACSCTLYACPEIASARFAGVVIWSLSNIVIVVGTVTGEFVAPDAVKVRDPG